MATQTGYKASELGVIPLDWDVVELGAVAKVEMCRRIFKNETLNVGDIPFYKIGTFGGEADAYISRQLFEEYKSKYPYPKIGDVLISAAGTIGRVVVFDGEEAYYQDSNIVWLNINKAKISNSFLYYFYQNTEWDSLEGSTIKRLYNNDLLLKKIAIPKSTAEQTAIATALSDTDALISSLQTLIAKKQAIKLSAMQNLLGGKIRLPEFAQRPDGSPKTTRQTELGCVPEDWEVVELGEVLSYEQPGKYIIHNDDLKVGDIPVLTAGKTFILGYTIEDFNCYENYPVIIFDDFTTDSKLVNFRFKVKSSAMKMLKPKKNDMPIELIFMLLQNINFIVGDHKRHWISEFQHLKIAIPKSPAEQTAIAQLLSDMDAEIEALECRLKKTQSLKQGMMQALLTGKIRLPLE